MNVNWSQIVALQKSIYSDPKVWLAMIAAFVLSCTLYAVIGFWGFVIGGVVLGLVSRFYLVEPHLEEYTPKE